MEASDLLSILVRRGVKLWVRGDRLRYEAPPGALTPQLLEAMRRHKARLIELLSWPSECLESLMHYHRPPALNAPHAILFPIIGRKVQTPCGPGRLLQAFAGRTTVVLESEPDHAVFLDPHDIRPMEVFRP